MNPRDADKLLPLLRDLAGVIEAARGVIDAVGELLPWVKWWAVAVVALLAVIAIRGR